MQSLQVVEAFVITRFDDLKQCFHPALRCLLGGTLAFQNLVILKSCFASIACYSSGKIKPSRGWISTAGLVDGRKYVWVGTEINRDGS